jgi:hypothetical protein
MPPLSFFLSNCILKRTLCCVGLNHVSKLVFWVILCQGIFITLRNYNSISNACTRKAEVIYFPILTFLSYIRRIINYEPANETTCIGTYTCHCLINNKQLHKVTRGRQNTPQPGRKYIRWLHLPQETLYGYRRSTCLTPAHYHLVSDFNTGPSILHTLLPPGKQTLNTSLPNRQRESIWNLLFQVSSWSWLWPVDFMFGPTQ